MPTGDYGYREVVVTIELQDEKGQMREFKKESLFVEMKTALQYKEKDASRFALILMVIHIQLRPL